MMEIKMEMSDLGMQNRRDEHGGLFEAFVSRIYVRNQSLKNTIVVELMQDTAILNMKDDPVKERAARERFAVDVIKQVFDQLEDPVCEEAEHKLTLMENRLLHVFQDREWLDKNKG